MVQFSFKWIKEESYEGTEDRRMATFEGTYLNIDFAIKRNKIIHKYLKNLSRKRY